MNLDYIINPVKMGGLVKEVTDNKIKIHLHGRLGVIKVAPKLIRHDGPIEIGHETEFYFSYIQVVKDPLDYDASEMTAEGEMIPSLLGGVITEVNDTAIEVAIMNDLGSIAVPRRWAFTPMTLEEGQHVEFYFSPIDVIGKRDVPVESI